MRLTKEQKAALSEIKSKFNQDFASNIFMGLNATKAYLKACKKHKKLPSGRPDISAYKLTKRDDVAAFVKLTRADPAKFEQTIKAPVIELKNFIVKTNPNTSPEKGANGIEMSEVQAQIQKRIDELVLEQINLDKSDVGVREWKRNTLLTIGEMRMLSNLRILQIGGVPPSSADGVSALSEVNRMDEDHKKPEGERKTFTPVPIGVKDAS